MQNKIVHITSFGLVIAGGLNFGLVGLFRLDLLDLILGGDSAVARIVYVLIGAAAVVLVATHKKDCQTCGLEDHAAASTGPTPPSA